jgi:thiol-disulfide isomerase/thioredoxin
MKIINVNAIWCGSCISMKNTWREIEKSYVLNIVNYDYDFDEEVKQYNVSNILPVSIFLDDNGNELCRLIGEKKKEEIVKIIEQYK